MGSIIVCGDIAPTKSNYDAFGADINCIVDPEILEILSRADYRICNLETPLYDGDNPIIKDGPNLKAPVKTAAGIKQMRFNLASMANNHILDHGPDGLRSSISALDACGIDHVGAGADRREAARPFYFLFHKKKIGVYACADHEFTIAGENCGGANHFDPLYSLDHIMDAKKSCDYLIVLYHGSKKYYPYPTPETQAKCRRMVDKGADLVLCQHSHCVGCEEKYQGGTILYGQGNFLFDLNDNAATYTGLMVFVDDDLNISYRFVIKNGNGVRLAGETENRKLLDEFYSRSGKVSDMDFLSENYASFCKETESMYLRTFFHFTFLQKVLNKLSHGRYLERLASGHEKDFVRYINYMRCEAHREVWINCLKKYCPHDRSV